MQYGKHHVDTAQQNPCVAQEAQVTSEGVYIQDINSKLRTTDWCDNSAKANAVAFITQEPQIPSEGVYIQDVNGKLWKADDWDSSVQPNAIAVIAKETKFLIALTEPSSDMQISRNFTDPFEKYITGIPDKNAAITDDNGAENTANILKLQPSTDYAAGYCNAFVFPDGKTNGFLPSLGQWNLFYQNKTAVDAALAACGGDAIYNGDNLSSTFKGIKDNTYKFRCIWTLNWYNGTTSTYYSNNGEKIRPFAAY